MIARSRLTFVCASSLLICSITNAQGQKPPTLAQIAGIWQTDSPDLKGALLQIDPDGNSIIFGKPPEMQGLEVTLRARLRFEGDYALIRFVGLELNKPTTVDAKTKAMLDKLDQLALGASKKVLEKALNIGMPDQDTFSVEDKGASPDDKPKIFRRVKDGIYGSWGFIVQDIKDSSITFNVDNTMRSIGIWLKEGRPYALCASQGTYKLEGGVLAVSIRSVNLSPVAGSTAADKDKIQFQNAAFSKLLASKKVEQNTVTWLGKDRFRLNRDSEGRGEPIFSRVPLTAAPSQ